MRVVLRQTGRQIQRKFVKRAGPFWSALWSLAASTNLPEAYKTTMQFLKDQQDDVFFKFVDVPWYFDEVGRYVLKYDSKCTLHVKACGEYYFIQLSKPDGTLIGTPFFERLRPAKALSATSPTADLRGPGDLLLFLSTTLANSRDQRENGELLLWFDMELAIEIVARSGTARTVAVTRRLRWPHPASTVRWDSTQDPDKYFVEYAGRRILVASPNVRKAVSGVAEVWHNPSVASVLLSAWTGSGKDPLQRLLTYGLRQPDELPTFSAPSLLSDPMPAEQKISEELVKHKLAIPATSRGPWRLKRRTVVIVDEIHHPSAQRLREALLRPMETSRLDHAGKRCDCNGLLTLLFNASEPPDKLRKHNPVDFWTRIEHTIQMSHPLALPTQDERTLALEQYFGLFWAMALKDGAATNYPFTLLTHAECTSIMGGRFAALLNSPFIPIISMRMLRSVVKRIANRAVYALKTQAIEFDNRAKTDADRARSLGKAITKKLVEQWLKELFDEIVPSVQPEGAF